MGGGLDVVDVEVAARLVEDVVEVLEVTRVEDDAAPVDCISGQLLCGLESRLAHALTWDTLGIPLILVLAIGTSHAGSRSCPIHTTALAVKRSLRGCDCREARPKIETWESHFPSLL